MEHSNASMLHAHIKYVHFTFVSHRKKTQRRQMPNYRLAQSDQIDEVERRMHNTRSEKMTSKVDVCCLCICFVCM